MITRRPSLRRRSPISYGLAGWRERQADLWAGSAAIARVHHRLTAEEAGLWTAVQLTRLPDPEAAGIAGHQVDV